MSDADAFRGRDDYLPRDVFFFLGVTAFPLSAACFCFFFAGMFNLPVLADEDVM